MILYYTYNIIIRLLLNVKDLSQFYEVGPLLCIVVCGSHGAPYFIRKFNNWDCVVVVSR
jgi:hypothetical protein